MLDNQAEQVAELEWMLQNGETTPAMLVEALVQATCPAVIRLGMAYLGSQAAAVQAARKIYPRLLSNLSHYRSDRGALVWLYRAALQVLEPGRRRRRIGKGFKNLLRLPASPAGESQPVPENEAERRLWETVDSLPASIRTPVLFRYLLGWQPAEIGRLLGQPEAEVRSHLAAARERLSAGTSGTAFDNQHLDQTIRRSLQRRWPEQPLPSGAWGSIAAAAQAAAQPRPPRRRLVSLTQVLGALLAAVLVLGLVWSSGRLLPEPQPTPRHRSRSAAPAATLPAGAPTATPAPTRAAQRTPPTPTPPPPIHFFAQPGDTLRLVAIRFGVLLDDLIEINHLSPDEAIPEGQPVWVPVRGQETFSTPTPVAPPGDLLAPLSMGGGSEEIYRYLLLSERQWNTLWADIQIRMHGPPGYVGPPLAIREQVWVSQPNQSKALLGPQDRKPRLHFVLTNGQAFSMDQIYQAMSFPEPGILLKHSQAREVIFPAQSTWIHQKGRFQIQASERIAGRETLVIDWFNPSGGRERRLWVDAHRGVILRMEQYAGTDWQTLEVEIRVSAVEYDVNFPPELFDPLLEWSGGYALDYRGRTSPDRAEPPVLHQPPAPGHEPLPMQLPPQGFDASRSQLTFQYPSHTEDEPSFTDARPVFDLFAGGYYLGSLPFARPWGLQCDRSPDGSRLAYVYTGYWLDFSGFREETRLRWFDVQDPGAVQSVDLYPWTSFAFAPGGRLLAVFGAARETASGIFLVDTDSGEYRRLAEFTYADGLVWSPDGEQLALIGLRGGWRQPAAVVVSADTGELIYQVPVDPDILSSLRSPGRADWPAPDWPGHAWGVSFPAPRQGLGACILPPGE